MQYIIIDVQSINQFDVVSEKNILREKLIRLSFHALIIKAIIITDIIEKYFGGIHIFFSDKHSFVEK